MHQKRNGFLVTVQRTACLGLGAALLGGCGGSSDPTNTLPAGVSQLSRTAYPATSVGSGSTAATQDLLTAGLGKSGLLSTSAVPAYADPAQPTADELRRNAVLSNYRGLVDVTAKGGFGSLFGPNVDLAGNATASEGLVPGLEYLGVLDNAAGTKRVTLAAVSYTHLTLPTSDLV